MKISTLLLLLFSLFFNTVTLAQDTSISGILTDETGTPVEFANIVLKNIETPDIQIGTISETDGAFKLEVKEKGDYELRVSFIGFTERRDTLQITEDTNLGTIKMALISNDLETVVVTGSLKIIERKEDKLIFNVQSSPLKSGYDGMEVLERSPNVWVDQNGSILMRNESATILINGRVSNLSGADLANYIQNLRSDDIKNIEIQTSLSANTDAESSGGVINIILKKKPVGFDASLQTEYTIKSKGDFRTYTGFNFNYGSQKWNIYGNYNYQRNTAESDNQSSIDYFVTQNFLKEDGRHPSDRNRHNYQLGFVADPVKNHVFGLEGFATNYANDYENLSLVNISNGEELLDNGRADLVAMTDLDLYNVTFNYAWTMDTLGSSLKFFADYANQDITRQNTAVSSYEEGYYTGVSERNNANAGTDIYGLQLDVEKKFRNGLKFEIGSKLSNTQRENVLQSDFLISEEWIANERTRSFDYGEQVLAAYLSISKNISKKDFVKIGLRLENTDLERVDLSQDTIFGQNYTDLFPSVYYSRELSNDNSISLSYSRRLRRPSFRFLNNYVIKVNDFRFELGNPELRPEYVNNYELSFKQKKQTIDLYLQRTNEAINGIYFLEEEISFYKKFNSGFQTQYGISYNRFGNLYKWWYTRASTGFYNRKFTEEGEDKFQRVTGYVSLTNNFKLNKTTNFELSGYYRSKHEDAYYIADEIYDVRLMLQKTFFNKKLMARIYFNDIFNTLLYTNERPFSEFRSTTSVKPQTRTIRLWLRYNFSGKSGVNKRKNKSKNDARRRL